MASSSYCCYELRLPYCSRFETDKADSEPHNGNNRLLESSVVSPDRHDQPHVEAFVSFSQRLIHLYLRVKTKGHEVVYDSDVKQNVKFTHFKFSLFKCYECAFSKLSECLSSMGIESEEHDKILRDAICHYGKMTMSTPDECISFMGQRMMSIFFQLEATVLRFSHEECLTARSTTGIVQSDMGPGPACEKAVEEQVNRVDMSIDCMMGYVVDTVCSICLEKFDMDLNTDLEGSHKFMATMPCSHVFHDKCILQWLKKSQYCPLCRFKIQFQIHTDCYS